MKVKNLFLIQSPYQAIVAAQAAVDLVGEDEESVAIVLARGNEVEEEQIACALKMYEWSRCEFFLNEGPAWFKMLNARMLVKGVVKEYKGACGRLFIGDFRSKWMHYVKSGLNPERCYVLDDGAATISIFNKYIAMKKYWPREEKGWKSFVFNNFSYFGLKKREIPLVFYTSYQGLSNGFSSSVIVHSNSLLKSRFKRKNINKKEVIYFGSKYSESGVVSFSYEKKLLSNIFLYYLLSGFKVAYFPHREDSEAKKLFIKSFGAVEIVSSALPAELYLSELECLPGIVAGAYTSVLFNMNKIGLSSEINSFLIREEFLSDGLKKTVKDVYEEIEKEGVKVIDLGF